MMKKINREEFWAIFTGVLVILIAVAWLSFGQAVLECGDSFETDGENRNGWFRVMNRGECECFIYCGYVVTDEPKPIGENYVCVAKNRVACRRWVDGPQIEDNGRPRWLVNGSNVSVFYIAEGWAVTSRGYIQSEWLEVDPE